MAKKKGPGAGSTFKKTDYGIPAEVFVTEWEKAETAEDVFEALKAYSTKNGRPVMPKPIILSRASVYRSGGVPLKRMSRAEALDVKKLTDLVNKAKPGGPPPVAQTLAPKARPAPRRGLTREEVEEVVVEVLRKHGLVK